MSIPKTEEMLDLTHTAAAALFCECTYPWEALPRLAEFVRKLGASLSPEEYEAREGDVWIHRSAKVAPSALIMGPTVIGEGSEVRHCAYIRGSVLVGAGCVVGNSTELKNAVLFDNVQVPHYNYVGDSVLGYRSHMGAGAIASNVKSDKTAVTVRDGEEKIATGLRKLGAILGDHVEIGCGSVLCPGAIVGRGAAVYPLSRVRGTVAAETILKADGVCVPKRE